MLAKCFFQASGLHLLVLPCVMVSEGRSLEMLAKCFFQASGLHLPVRKWRSPVRNGERGMKPRDACQMFFFRLVACTCLCARGEARCVMVSEGRSPEMLAQTFFSG